MKAGALRHRITFQKLTVTQGTRGGPVENWENYATVWAEVVYLRVGSREFWDAHKANSEAHGRVRIRHRPDIKPTMRIKYAGKTLHILVPFTYDTKNKEMHLLFKEALD